MTVEKEDEGERGTKGEDKLNKERIIGGERCDEDDANAEKYGKQWRVLKSIDQHVWRWDVG